MYRIREKDGVIYAKYQTERPVQWADEREVDEALYLRLEVPCTLTEGGEVLPAQPPQADMLPAGTRSWP